MNGRRLSKVYLAGLFAAVVLGLLIWGSPSHVQGPGAGVSAVALADADNDGLPNLLEAPNGCDSAAADTDSDGLNDGQEASVVGSSCNKVDSDGDGSSDSFESSWSGTATGANPTSLTDTSQSWVTDQWVGYVLRITGNPGAGQTRVIVSNSDLTLNIDPSSPWADIPVTSPYIIQKVGTDPLAACAADAISDNEDPDALPADLN
ncbi:MAG: hypothetical protein GTN78_05670, partial [Gemmatimonadales bacterium]|nr:hypothetical protein [Gemmatimonadales bacterium]NIQ99676.1 hypothetical protein [Gemmatimonadales bacterium]NIS64200.1 hypothetical protein [Gemmatimonadales bacterium]